MDPLNPAPPLSRDAPLTLPDSPPAAPPELAGNAQTVARRRILFFTAVFCLTCIGTLLMADFLWRAGITQLKIALIVLFVPLSARIACGLCQALSGTAVLLRGGDPLRITHTLDDSLDEDQLPLTAILMPVCNENADRVFHGIRTIHRSLEETGRLQRFHFFVLSDSTDPDRWIQEELAWVGLCRELGASGRLFYRRRRANVNRKSGNIADFCRRWGELYRYMIVLDADSVMTGKSLVTLVRLMERNPLTGIIQTAPRLIGGETIFGRAQELASALYGRISEAGRNFWQQDEGNYIGHNAILRMEPFMKHCGLPELAGTERPGGRILSHDFAEAAFMRKAGWSVWLAYDLEGSYEQGPQTLVDFARRDSRCCQGNVQHARLLFAPGFNIASRIHFLAGTLSCMSPLLWLLFLLLGSLALLRHRQSVLNPVAPSGFANVWSIDLVTHGLLLLGAGLAALLLPKICAVLVAPWRDFGGGLRLLRGALLETILSALLAPILMLFRTKFVLSTILRRGITWPPQDREATGTDWNEAAATHAGHTLFGAAGAAFSVWMHPAFLLWLSPLLIGPILSIPISVWTSRPLRRTRLFPVPAGTSLLATTPATADAHLPREGALPDAGLLHAILDPYANAVHVSLLRARPSPTADKADYLAGLRARVLRDTPVTLTAQEKLSLLLDGDSIFALHRQLWLTPSNHLPGKWREIFHHYTVWWRTPARSPITSP